MDALKRTFGMGGAGEAASETPSHGSHTLSASQPVSPFTSPRRAPFEPSASASSSRLLSMWNNMKYGKTLFALESATSGSGGVIGGAGGSPVYLLGMSYQKRKIIDFEGRGRMTSSLDRNAMRAALNQV